MEEPLKVLDLQWKFGVTASNEELDAVGSSFIQLSLLLQRDASSAMETLQFELSLPQFYALLRSLEQAQLQTGAL